MRSMPAVRHHYFTGPRSRGTQHMSGFYGGHQGNYGAQAASYDGNKGGYQTGHTGEAGHGIERHGIRPGHRSPSFDSVTAQSSHEGEEQQLAHPQSPNTGSIGGGINGHNKATTKRIGDTGPQPGASKSPVQRLAQATASPS